jgi:hypothetical protein
MLRSGMRQRATLRIVRSSMRSMGPLRSTAAGAKKDPSAASSAPAPSSDAVNQSRDMMLFLTQG